MPEEAHVLGLAGRDLTFAELASHAEDGGRRMLEAIAILKRASTGGAPVVRRSRELELVEEEAGIPYVETRLAKRAKRARPRLVVLLLIGAGLFVIEVFAGPRPFALAPALALALVAWGVRQGRLGGVVSAALVALLAVLVPLGLVFLGTPDRLALFAMAVSAALGLAALPDILTLVRDAELQHAYGLWARRE